MNKEELQIAFRETMQPLVDKTRDETSPDEEAVSFWGETLFFEGYKIAFYDFSMDDPVWPCDYLRIEVFSKNNPSGNPISTKESWYGYEWDPFDEDMVNEIVEYVVEVIMKDKARNNESA